MSFIKLENVNKIYGDKKEAAVHALKDINLVIDSGELVAIVGKSGSGKSTLLNILGCTDKHNTGTYILEDRDISKYSENDLAKVRNSVFGFVLQYFGLIESFNIYNNVIIPLEYAKVPKKEYRKRVEEVLDKLGIKDKINSIPSNLSGGQCQRVAIARAMINNPKVILADEPTGALDSETSLEIVNLLKELNENGTTVIIVTHDEGVANSCNRIIRLEDGAIVSDTINS